MLPYARQQVDEADIAAVVEVLRGDWLTTGPAVEAFERKLAEVTGAAEAVAVSSGTAALHAAMYALGVGTGDEVIVPAMTFPATANAAVFLGATPVFADVDADTLLIDPASVGALITPRTRVITAVDYAGQPCDYDTLRSLARRHGVALAADACHALGGAYKDRPVGSLADASAFSFHAVKPITTGEGGAVTTNDVGLARRLRMFRNHGITTDHHRRAELGSWHYEMVDLGFNYRITDIQCALGSRQLEKLGGWVERRRAIASRYDRGFADLAACIRPLSVKSPTAHAYHLYVVQIEASLDRSALFGELRRRGIGVNVHYIPVHLHPYYRKRFGTGPGLCPVAEAAYERIISLPMFPAMTDADVDRVISTVRELMTKYVTCAA